MKMFIELKVPVNYTDTLNQTVLYYVVRENQLRCVDMLISQGNSLINT